MDDGHSGLQVYHDFMIYQYSVLNNTVYNLYFLNKIIIYTECTNVLWWYPFLGAYACILNLCFCNLTYRKLVEMQHWYTMALRKLKRARLHICNVDGLIFLSSIGDLKYLSIVYINLRHGPLLCPIYREQKVDLAPVFCCP